MYEAQLPPLVTPLVGMLSADASCFAAARAGLEALLGPLDMESPLYPFDGTDYYTPTMGAGLQRQFYSFQNLSDSSLLADWKRSTIALEEEIKQRRWSPGQPPRPINLDVGYMTGAKLVLASTKNCAHRIYLRDGIFAEITLSFRKDGWTSHDFTFPDFKSRCYDDFLSRVRQAYLRRMKERQE